MQSLGLELQEESGFSSALVSTLFGLEVQYLIEHSLEGDATEFAGIKQVYGIPEARAQELFESVCRRYVSQLLSIALRLAKKYDEANAMVWMKRLLRYAVYLSDAVPVEVDGSLYTDADKERLIGFYQDEIENIRTANGRAAAGGSSMRNNKIKVDQELAALYEQHGDQTEQLRRMIHINKDRLFRGAQQGVEGMQGGGTRVFADVREKMAAMERGDAVWAWG